KQVMQEIDSTFDEKNLGIAKFSRFCQEAAQRGLLSVTKLDNGQLEVDLPLAEATGETPIARAEAPATEVTAQAPSGEERGGRRGRRGRGGRGRDREREPRESVQARAETAPVTAEHEVIAPPAVEPEVQPERAVEPPVEHKPAAPERKPVS